MLFSTAIPPVSLHNTYYAKWCGSCVGHDASAPGPTERASRRPRPMPAQDPTAWSASTPSDGPGARGPHTHHGRATSLMADVPRQPRCAFRAWPSGVANLVEGGEVGTRGRSWLLWGWPRAVAKPSVALREGRLRTEPGTLRIPGSAGGGGAAASAAARTPESVRRGQFWARALASARRIRKTASSALPSAARETRRS